MKIHSLKLTLQDIVSSDGEKVAAIFGTVLLDTGEVKKDINGPVLDAEGKQQPVYESINFTTALANVEHFKQIAQQMIVEALTLKNMKIAKRNGELSHFIKSVGGSVTPKAPRGFRNTMADTGPVKKKAPRSTTAPRKKAK